MALDPDPATRLLLTLPAGERTPVNPALQSPWSCWQVGGEGSGRQGAGTVVAVAGAPSDPCEG
jgi:hypothetical protein